MNPAFVTTRWRNLGDAIDRATCATAT